MSLSQDRIEGYEAKVAAKKVALAAQAKERYATREYAAREWWRSIPCDAWEYREIERRASERRWVDDFNDDHPGGCEKCGEGFDLEGGAEVVTATGVHLVVHPSCISGEVLA